MKFCILVFIFLLTLTADAASWPEMPFPKESKVNIVSESMIFNGLPMRTWTLNSEENLESVVQFYRNKWKPIKDSLYDEKVQDGWVYINSKQGGFVLTAKISESLGRVQAYLGISHFEARVKNYIPGKNFPLPRGSKVINDIVESDIGKKSRYLFFNTQQTVADTYKYYLKKFEKEGWQTIAAMIDEKKSDAVIALQKDGDEMNVSMYKLGRMTQVSASKVEKTLVIGIN